MVLRNKQITSISWPDEALLEAAKKRAAELGFSFSQYVCQVIRREVLSGGDFVVKAGGGDPLQDALVRQIVEQQVAAVLNEGPRPPTGGDGPPAPTAPPPPSAVRRRTRYRKPSHN
ncbi:MAG: hypothetical protein H7A46_04770 [Verrucomicrobiales bacterium]|nr:hypothetical protein [Verrucomicrobiales bacterium]